jgi:hypothetical protein
MSSHFISKILQGRQNSLIKKHKFSYADPANFEGEIKTLQQFNRPIIATEYMARSRNNEFMNILPLGKKYNIGMISWGSVNGKVLYNLPWDSAIHPYIAYPPTVWFQDIFRQDRTPYLLEEAQLIKRLNGTFYKQQTKYPNLGCPFGYHSSVNNWTCYNNYDTPLSFSDAQMACKDNWANVVTINNAFENGDIRGV